MQRFTTIINGLAARRETFYSVIDYNTPQTSAHNTPQIKIVPLKNTNLENGQAGA